MEYISNFINSNSVCHTNSELNLLQVLCEETKAEVLRGTWGIVYCTKLSWNVFVEITEESYISAAVLQDLPLLADIHTGRRVIKPASLEIHHCRALRQFSAILLFFLSLFWSIECATVHLFQTQRCLRELTSCQTSVKKSCLSGTLLSVSAVLSQPSCLNGSLTSSGLLKNPQSQEQ